ncbi:hypothetical protein Tco_0065380 [Tanacetum coccineum]
MTTPPCWKSNILTVQTPVLMLGCIFVPQRKVSHGTFMSFLLSAIGEIVVTFFACPGVLVSIVNICHVSSSCFQSGSNTISNQLPDGSLSHVDLTGDEDPTDEDGDIGVSVSLGDEIYLEGKKSQESSIGDSDNTGDGGKTTGEKTSMSKRYLVKSSDDSGETFLGEAGK